MSREAITLSLPEQTQQASFYEPMSCMQETVHHLQQAATRSGLIGLVTITLQFEQAGRNPHAQNNTRSIHYLLEHLRPLVRKTDRVLQLEQTSYFVLHGANEQGATIVQERLWDALLWTIHNMNEKELRRPWSIEAGHSAYPAPYNTLEQILRAAHEPIRRFVLREEKTVHKASVTSSRTEQEKELSQFARRLGIPYLPLLPRKLPARIQRLISQQVAQELACYPVGRERDTLTVAMANPQDKQAIERLQHETGLRIFPVLTHPQELHAALENWSR
jgi:hypothetical protein